MWDTTDVEQEVWDLSLEWPSEDYSEELAGLVIRTRSELEDLSICTTTSECYCDDCTGPDGCPW